MRRAGLILIVLGILRGSALASPPVVKTINGNPLTINIGDDTSFQIFDSSVPGAGQIYPSGGGSCTGAYTGDMGYFVDFGSLLYGPSFSDHCVSATPFSSLSYYRPWVPISIGDVTGSGTTTDPFTCVVVVSAPGPPDLQLTLTVLYLNGQNYFLANLQFSSSAGGAFNIFMGADLYLANSDNGVPYLHTASGSVGGQTCVSPPYTILLIPLDAADAHTATTFFGVWQEIANGSLDNTVDTVCEDDGAALAWMNRAIPAGGTLALLTAGSFGTIPSIVTCGGAPAAPGSPAISPTANPTGPVTATDYLTYSWSAPSSGQTPAGYKYHINSDTPVSTTDTSVSDVPPLGLRADAPITLGVLAFACSPEADGPEAQSPPYSLAAPGASFSASATSVSVGGAVNFTDTSSPQATSWYWFFGDGGSSTDQNPAHTFAAGGLYAVYEIASNGSGSSVSAPSALNVGASAIHTSSAAQPESDDTEIGGRGGGGIQIVTEAPPRPVVLAPGLRREWIYPGLTLVGRNRLWLTLQTAEPTIAYLRFERDGVLLGERRLSLPGGGPTVVDVGAYRANIRQETLDLKIVAERPVAAVLSEGRP
jgi:hypothetical protein